MKVDFLKGEYGEKIFVDRLQELSTRNNSYNVMKNVEHERHFYDIMIQKWNLVDGVKYIDKTIEKIEIKTYEPLLKYPNATGMNENHWLEYKQLPELLIVWVDTKHNIFYGNFVENLIDNEFTLYTTKKENRICWNIKDYLIRLDKIIPGFNYRFTNDEINNFKKIYNILGTATEIQKLVNELL